MASILSAEDAFMFNLESALQAAQDSVSDPVTIASGIPSGELKTAFSRIYYDAEDNGHSIMQKRLENAAEDIVTAIEMHQSMLLWFYDIRHDLMSGDRFSLEQNVNALAGQMKHYSEFVKKHQQRQKDSMFLYMPSAIPGHFEIYGPSALELAFNPEQTLEGVAASIASLADATRSFVSSKTAMEDSYRQIKRLSQKIQDYRRGYQTTKFLLKSA